MVPRERSLFQLCVALAILGVLDAGYLTITHYQNTSVFCGTLAFADCDRVLQSSYAFFFGVPLALIGLFHYSLFALALIAGGFLRVKIARYATLLLSTIGLVASLYFVYVQGVAIQAICLYCLGSAVISVSLFFLAQAVFPFERKRLVTLFLGFLYRSVMKPVLFSIDAERVHARALALGETLGKSSFARRVFSYDLVVDHPSLRTSVAGIEFPNPIGLAAGFDYEAKLIDILPSLGFGFETIGTITNMPYEGNPKPRLGRLPRSRSLMVNKGFKNRGAKSIAEKLNGRTFVVPIGISIGRTNSLALTTQEQSIDDIVAAFRTFESPPLRHSYYELNISCPNLFGDISFYPPKNLDELLSAVDALTLSRPVFVKMPIEKNDEETLAMLEVVARHSPKGVIFGNLQKGRSHPTLNQDEVTRFNRGNFSGKPTFVRSNELISLAYRRYQERFVIIGCGGVFSGRDAYEKIKLGASLVQLITGMVFEGPQLIAQINLDLLDLLAKNGYTHISQAVGAKNRM